MKSSVLLASGLFRRIERTRTTSEMFVAIIICLRGYRYKRDATRTSSVFVSHLLLHPPSLPRTKPCFFSLDLAVLSLDFSTSICYALGTSLVPFFLPFDERARNCPAVRAIVREDGGNPGADGEPVRTNAKGYEDSERTCPETYAPKAGDKQERDRKLVLRIGSVT